MAPRLNSLDHLVLTVADIPATLAFYSNVLGMTEERFHPDDGSTRHALRFGSQKINLHPKGGEFDPKAHTPTTGSADLCFLSAAPLSEWQSHLSESKVPILEGPVRRTGATGSILSIYLRDPDGNLIEISTPV